MEEQFHRQPSLDTGHHGKWVPDTPGDVGDWRYTRPSPVAVWVSVGGAGPFLLCSSLAPGFGDRGAYCGEASWPVSGDLVHMVSRYVPFQR